MNKKNFFYLKVIHIVGIGGIGMSAIAQFLHRKNFIVQGCDIKKNDRILRLIKLGLNINIMAKKYDMLYCDLVVHSSAINKKNIRLTFSIKNKKKSISRSTLISEIVKNFYNICITGSHGKTSVTSMIYNVIKEMKILPTTICGGIIKTIRNNYYNGKSKINIIESDESDGTFIFLPSNYQIINNNDIEHLDYFKNNKNLKNIFGYYIQRITKNCLTLICNNCINLNKNNKVTKIYKRCFSYSIKFKKCDFYASMIRKERNKINVYIIKSIKTQRILSIKKKIIDVKNKIGGYKLLNILIGKVMYLLINGQNFLLDYSNKIKKRFSKIIKVNYINYIEDYAHHPEEIKSILNSLFYNKKKTITVFEPHNIKRLKTLEEKFMTSFYKTDILINTNLFLKKNCYNNNYSIKFIKKIQYINCNSFYFKNKILIEKYLLKTGLINDYILFLGAGGIFEIINKVIKNINIRKYMSIVKKTS